MSRAHLLLVDHDPQNLQLMEVSLRKAGFQVTTSTDGRDALGKAALLEPDLVLSEMALPGLDGFALLEALRSQPKTASLPVVFLTEDTRVEQRVRALEAGVADYLSKPIYIKEIVARVRIHLQRREQQRLLDAPGTDREGSLADMGLIDLLRSLEGRTGVVTCAGVRGETAALWVRDGRVEDAQLGRLEGEAAFYRLLGWSDGRWHLHQGDFERTPRIELSSAELLSEGLRRLDEWERQLERLPGLEAVFEVDFVALAARLGEIPDEVNAVLRLLDGRRVLRQVVEDSPFEDAATLAVINRLLEERIVRHVRVSAPSSPVLRALEGWGATPSPLPSATRAAVRRSPESTPLPVSEDGRPLRGAALARALASRSLDAAVTPVIEPAPVEEPAPVAEAPLEEPAPIEAAPVEEPTSAEAARIAAAPVEEPAPVEAAPVEEPSLEAPAEEPVATEAADSPLDPADLAASWASQESFDDANAWAGPSDEEEEAPAAGSFDLEKLLGLAPRPTGQADEPELIPVMRYPPRQGARLQRLEQEARLAREAAAAQAQAPTPLSNEVLRPGARIDEELVARVDLAVSAESASAEPEAPAPVEEAAPVQEPSSDSVVSAVDDARAETEPTPLETPTEAPVPAAVPEARVDSSDDSDEDDDDDEFADVLRRNRRGPLIAGGVAVVALAAVGLVLGLQGGDQPKTEPQPAPVTARPAVDVPAPVQAPAATDTQPAEAVADAGLPEVTEVVEAAPEPAPVAEPAAPPVQPEPVAKPAEAKPVEVKTAEAKPAEVKPAEIKPAEAPTAKIASLVEAGLAASKREQWSKVGSTMRQVLKLDPKHPVALRELGKAQYAAEQLSQARASLLQATSLAADDADAFMYLGIVCQELDRADEARRAYQRFLQLEPATSPRHKDISAVLENMGR